MGFPICSCTKVQELLLTGIVVLQDTPVQTPGRYDAAFTEALHGDKGEVHLLRLLQKTGIGGQQAALS